MIALISLMMSLTVIHTPLTVVADNTQSQSQLRSSIKPSFTKTVSTNSHHQYYFQVSSTQIQKVNQEREEIQKRKAQKRQARLQRQKEKERQKRLARQRERRRREKARHKKLRTLARQKQVDAASGSQITSYIDHYCGLYGCNTQKLIEVMHCESGGRVKASNGTHHGIFQFLPSTFQANAARVGISNPNIWSPKQQSQVAAWMFANGQSWQWTCA